MDVIPHQVKKINTFLILMKDVKAKDSEAYLSQFLYDRSSHSEMFLGKGVLRICNKFTGEHPCQNAVSIKSLCNTSRGCFCYEYNEENIVKEKSYFQGSTKSSCIGLFLSDFPLSFQNTFPVKSGVFDFHKMVIVVMKMTFWNNPPW